MIADIGWQPLQAKRQTSKVTMMYCIINNLIDILSDNYLGPARGSSIRYIIPYCKTDYLRHSFVPSATRLSNQLPNHLMTSPSLEAFEEGKTKVTKRKHPQTKPAENNISKSSSKVKKPRASKDTNATKESERSKRAKNQRGWKLLDKGLRMHLENMIDSSMKLVKSRSQLSEKDDVQRTLSDVSRQVKAKLGQLMVPKCNYGNFKELKTSVFDLQEVLERNQLQIKELGAAIRQEERKVSSLEELRDSTENVELSVEIPKNSLQLPRLQNQE
ncbi:hypothetical protein DPMN_006659 [Dreissena polymorpha]|uniref:Centromere protein Q n=1 Tax=Dreissena polymorpha TaxID=45954 RepID=A0A9D4MV02_DREPO|nr:hypothetical protein DPMN_006659 [Dreissena polymorpha]